MPITFYDQLKGQNPQGQPVSIPVGGTAYERTANLTANQTFTTDWYDSTKYNIDLYINTSHAGSRTIDYSIDGTNVLNGFSVTTATNAGALRRGFRAPLGSWFRYTYTNGATATSSFYFKLSLLTDPVQTAADTLDDTMLGSTFATETKSAFVLKDPTTGIYSTVSSLNGGLPVTLTNPSSSTAVTGTVAVSNLPSSQAVTGTFFQATQPISASALPLPAGAATSTFQTAGNTSLASIDTKTLSAGQKAMAASYPVVIASDQSAVPVTVTNPIVKFAPITATTANTTLIAAVAGKKIRVVQLALNTDANAVLTFQSGTGGTAITGGFNLYANAPILSLTLLAGNNGQLILPYSPSGWFETASATLLNLSKTGGNVGGVIGYLEI